MHFIGKQERIKEHWNELVHLKGCNLYFQNNSDLIFSENERNKNNNNYKNSDGKNHRVGIKIMIDLRILYSI